jgi:hypothetical protein
LCQECSSLVHKKGKWAQHNIKKFPTLDDLEKMKFQRKKILEEILTTESEYVKDLEILRKNFITPLQTGKYFDMNGTTKDILVIPH